MEDMLKRIAEAFNEDPTTAGVTCAWLPDKRQFYASVSRYLGEFATGKVVVARGHHETLDGALVLAWTEFLALTGEA